MEIFKYRIWDGEKYHGPYPLWQLASISSIELEHECRQGHVEQWTGLRDRNGTEIYIGDIVRYRDDNTSDKTVKVANVYWMDWADWAKVPFLHPFGSPVSGRDVGDGRSVNTVFVTPPGECEVIGNVHESPTPLATEEEGGK